MWQASAPGRRAAGGLKPTSSLCAEAYLPILGLPLSGWHRWRRQEGALPQPGPASRRLQKGAPTLLTHIFVAATQGHLQTSWLWWPTCLTEMAPQDCKYLHDFKSCCERAWLAFIGHLGADCNPLLGH